MPFLCSVVKVVVVRALKVIPFRLLERELEEANAKFGSCMKNLVDRWLYHHLRGSLVRTGGGSLPRKMTGVVLQRLNL